VPQNVHSPDECVDYSDYTFVPWQWLVDLSPLKSRVSLVPYWNVTEMWLAENLNVSKEDTLTLRDASPYDFRFVDYSNDRHLASGKYHQSVEISGLQGASQRLIRLGSLFGSSRVHLRSKQNAMLRRDVRKSMAFASPALIKTADLIRDQLGGVFLGAHVRVGDGRFLQDAEETTRQIWWRLLYRESCKLLDPPLLLMDGPSLRTPHPPLDDLPKVFRPQVPCRRRLHTSPFLQPLNVPLFISTDAKFPTDDSHLAPFIDTFPCAFFLSDFAHEVAQLDVLVNEYDGLQMKPFVLPFLDAMVAARARDVAITNGSTFSFFIQDVLWRSHHGWEIVQRG
ncbi:hypothetical protein CONPUDRAFT_49190, partial [Coniophora puteana RWD-64-598 SS2]